MIYLLTVKEIYPCKEHIFIHKKYNHSRQLYSFTELYSFQRNIFIQGKHNHSGNLYPFKEIYSFKEHIFVKVQDHMFIQGNYIHLTTLRSRT